MFHVTLSVALGQLSRNRKLHTIVEPHLAETNKSCSRTIELKRDPYKLTGIRPQQYHEHRRSGLQLDTGMLLTLIRSLGVPEAGKLQ